MEAIYEEDKINYIGKILDEIFQGNKSMRILDVGAGTGGSGQLVSFSTNSMHIAQYAKTCIST